MRSDEIQFVEVPRDLTYAWHPLSGLVWRTLIGYMFQLRPERVWLLADVIGFVLDQIGRRCHELDPISLAETFGFVASGIQTYIPPQIRLAILRNFTSYSWFDITEECLQRRRETGCLYRISLDKTEPQDERPSSG